jgi:hypothetical protein
MPLIIFPLADAFRNHTGAIKMGVPPWGPKMPLPAVQLFISGITKDSTGAVLGSCTVSLYRTLDDRLMERVVSDPATGVYSFSSVGLGETYYIVAYKSGAPDVAGTTTNTLIGS